MLPQKGTGNTRHPLWLLFGSQFFVRDEQAARMRNHSCCVAFLSPMICGSAHSGSALTQPENSVNFVKLAWKLNLKMASSILVAKKFPGIRGVRKSGDSSAMSKNSIKFGLSRKSPRCAQCLKFQAEDPARIGEDEFEKLYSCLYCKKVKYCSNIKLSRNLYVLARHT